MNQSFAQKLSLTAAVLNCSTRKELCARFRNVNPATEFELERSYKWLQGRALPRSHQIYEDWAQLLGTEKSGTWLSACSTEAFLDEVCELFSADRSIMMERAEGFSGGFSPRGGSSEMVDDPLCGSYLCYSWAWSPYERGRLIRGQLQIVQKKRRVLEAEYREVLPGGDLICRGNVQRDGSLLQFDVNSVRGGPRERMTLSLLAPGRPVALMCGRLQGAIVAGPHSRPSSSRIVLVRCDEDTMDPEQPCYFDANAEAIGADLALRLPQNGDQSALAEGIFGFLTAHAECHADQISELDLERLAERREEGLRQHQNRISAAQ